MIAVLTLRIKINTVQCNKWASHLLHSLPLNYVVNGSVVKNLPASAGAGGDTGLIPELGRPPGVGNGNSVHYFCQDNPIVRET